MSGVSNRHRRGVGLWLLCGGVLACFALGLPLGHAEPPPAVTRAAPAASPAAPVEPAEAQGKLSISLSVAPPGEDSRAAIERALDRRMSFHYTARPLSKVASDLSRTLGITIMVMEARIREVDAKADPPITLHLRDITVRSALKLMFELNGLDLQAIILNDALAITPELETWEFMESQLYDITDLVTRRDITGERISNLPQLMDLLEIFAEQPQGLSWSEQLGGGREHVASQESGRVVLSILESESAHPRMAKHLADLRSLRDHRPIPLSPQQVAEAGVKAALQRQLDFDFDRMPLSSIAEQLSEILQINVILMRADLEAEQMKLDTPISFKGNGLSATAMLRLICHRHQFPMRVLVRHEVALLTSEARAGVQDQHRLFDVTDLTHSPNADPKVNGEDLMGLIERTTTGDQFRARWVKNGEEGESGDIAQFLANGVHVLVAQNNPFVLDGIGAVLDDIRRQRRQDQLRHTSPDERLTQALRRRLPLDFENVPFGDVLAKISQELQVPVELERSDAAAMLPELPPVTWHSSRMTVADVLDQLQPAPFEWRSTEGRRLLCYQGENAQPEFMETRTYDVADLVAVVKPSLQPARQLGTSPGFFQVPDSIAVPGRPAGTVPTATGLPATHLLQYDAKLLDFGSVVDELRHADLFPETRFAPLMQLILTATGGLYAPWQAADVEQGGTMSVVETDQIKALVIRQTSYVHTEIVELLDALRACRDTGRPDWSAPLPADSAAATSYRLLRLVSVDFQARPLSEVLAKLAEMLDVDLLISLGEDAEEGAREELLQQLVTLQLSDVPGSDVLGGLAEQIKLTWSAGDQCILFNDSSNCFINTVIVFDVAVLVVSRNASDVLVTDFTPLVDMLHHQSGGPPDGAWKPVDRDGGEIQIYDGGGVKALIVRQQPAVHLEIAQLLASLRRQAKLPF